MELLIVMALATMIFWNKGLGDWIGSFSNPVIKELDLSGIHSPNAVLMRKNGKVLGGINQDERIYPASMTKLMTAVIALEKLPNLEETITLTDDVFAGLAEQDATQAGFQPGETVNVKDLVYGVILPSGAECCIALSNRIAGSEEEFARLMNRKAQRLGMKNTNFRDSTGLHDPEHYSTVYDMALLLKYCMKNKVLREILTSPYYTTAGTNVHPDGITFYSTMHRNIPDPMVTEGRILGGKTGYTSQAGQCLASFAVIDNKEYILVTAGAEGTTESPYHIEDARIVYERLGRKVQELK